MRLLRRRYGSTVLQMILNFAGIRVFAASGQRHGVLRDGRRGVGGRQRSELVRRRPAGHAVGDCGAASCAMFGSITYVALDYLFPQWIGWVLGTVWATALRLAAMIFHRRLPTGPHELIK
jgi:hypothetical protein